MSTFFFFKPRGARVLLPDEPKWIPWAIVLVTLSAGAADPPSDDDPWKPYASSLGQ